MNRRRLQFTGGTSYTVTLPKKWIMSNGLQRNDPIFMYPLENGSLIVRSEERSGGRRDRITLTLDGLDRDVLFRRTVGSYVSGYRVIEFVSSEPIPENLREAIRDFVASFAGLEITDDSDYRIEVTDYLDNRESKPSGSIGRMKVAVRNILNDLCNNMKLGIHMGTLQNRDVEVDRIRMLLMRQSALLYDDPSMIPEMGVSLGEMSKYVSLAKMMEDIGDACVYINQELKSIEDRRTIMALADLMEGADLMGSLVSATDAVLKGSLSDAEKCMDSCRRAMSMTQSYKPEESTGMVDIIHATRVAEGLHRIAVLELDICELAIDNSVSSEHQD